jgi:CBS domain-containing protein
MPMMMADREGRGQGNPGAIRTPRPGEYFLGGGPRKHSGYPVVDKGGQLLGMLTRSSLLEHRTTEFVSGSKDSQWLGTGPIIAYDLVDRPVVVIAPQDSCRAAAELMAQAGVRRLPVVDRANPDRLLGLLTVSDLLKAHQRLVQEELKRERFLGPRRSELGPSPTEDPGAGA